MATPIKVKLKANRAFEVSTSLETAHIVTPETFNSFRVIYFWQSRIIRHFHRNEGMVMYNEMPTGSIYTDGGGKGRDMERMHSSIKFKK